MRSHKKAFIFSLDAFVAFTLALIALYSLIFFSAIPHAYYNSLLQAHDLAKDTLYTMYNAPSPDANYDNLLVYTIFHKSKSNIPYADIPKYVDDLIPEPFGYRFDYKDSESGEWKELYDSNRRDYEKLQATAYSVVFGYNFPESSKDNPFTYLTCSGGKSICVSDIEWYNPDNSDFEIKLIRLVVYV